MKILISGTFPEDKSPSRAHSDDAGIDLLASEDVIVRPGESVVVRASAVGLEHFFQQIVEEQDHGSWVWDNDLVIAGFVWDKSGLASRGITVLGGVIDKSYTKEVGVVLYNSNVRAAFQRALEASSEGTYKEGVMRAWDQEYLAVRTGDKIAQLVIQDVWVPSPESSDIEAIRRSIKDGARGDKGFGSTGK